MQTAIARNGYMLVLEDEMRDAATLQSWLEAWGWGVLDGSPRWPASVASTCSSLWRGEAQDCASPVTVVGAILCEVTEPCVFCFFLC